MIVINQVNLIGRLVNNPTNKGKSYSFLFVVNDFNRKSVFFRCYSTKELNNAISHLKKGDLCRISGTLASGKSSNRFSYFLFLREVEYFPKGLSSDESIEDVIDTFEDDLELSEV